MQHQEINFYRYFKAPPPLKSPLTFKIMWLLNLLFVFYLFLQFLIYSLQVSSLQNQKNELLQVAQQSENKFIQLKKNYPPLFFSQNIENIIKQLQKDIEAQEKILQSVLNRVRFSKDLTLLSETIPNHVWLTDIIITSFGHEVVLKGYSLSMSELQNFIDKLQKNPRFENYFLDIKNIQQAENQKNDQLQFEVSIVKEKK